MEPIQVVHPVTKQTITLFVIIGILLGVLVGMYIYKRTHPVIIPEPVVTEGEKFGKEIITFLNNFTRNKDMGVPRTVVVSPDEQLILISYPTSQETGAYGVIDYKNYKFYKELYGDFYVQGSIQPRAFLGNDKLIIIDAFSEEGDETKILPLRIQIGDFNGNILKDNVYTLNPNEEIKEIYNGGGKVYVRIGTKDNRESETFEIDPITLTLQLPSL